MDFLQSTQKVEINKKIIHMFIYQPLIAQLKKQEVRKKFKMIRPPPTFLLLGFYY
jgi:hypothetical protein